MARWGLVISYLATNRSPTYSCVVHLLRSRQRYRGVKKITASLWGKGIRGFYFENFSEYIYWKLSMRPFYLDSEFIDVLNTLERLHGAL